MRKLMTRGLSFLSAMVTACALLMPTLAWGQADIWDGGGADDNWTTNENWSDNTAPPVVAGNVGYRFGAAGSAQLVTDMNDSFQFGQLQLAGPAGFVVNSSTGSTMLLSGFNTGQVLAFITPSAGNFATLNVPITLITGGTASGTELNRRTFDTPTDTTLTINGVLSSGTNPNATANNGTFDVRKIGAGTLVLTAANSITSTFEATNGTLRLGNDAALGTATFIANNGAGNTVRLIPNDAAPRTLANPITLGGAGPLVLTEPSGASMTLTGAVATTSVKPIGVLENTTATISGPISGAGGLAKNNPGTLILTGANTYTGQTVINNGTLVVNGSSASDTIVGAGTLQGTGGARVLSIFDEATNPFDPGTLSPADDTTAGTFTAGRADFADGGDYLFNLNDVNSGAGVGWDLLNLTGAGTANANLDVAAGAGGFTINVTGPGSGFNDALDATFTLVDADAVTNFDPGDFVVVTTGFAPSYTGTFSVSDANGNLNLVYTAVPEPTAVAVLGLAAVAMIARRTRA